MIQHNADSCNSKTENKKDYKAYRWPAGNAEEELQKNIDERWFFRNYFKCSYDFY